jgi:TRAP-type C4-dicarboxylate transport system permease small subunit
MKMERFLGSVRRLSKWANTLAGLSLTFIMGITVLDVILRLFRKPIVGTYELVGFAGAVVIGFAIPLTSWDRAQIFVDFFVEKLPKVPRGGVHLLTRLMSIGLFGLLGWNLFRIASDYQRSGEVSPTLELPFYPVAYGLGVACFLQCLVLICHVVKILGGKYE